MLDNPSIRNVTLAGTMVLGLALAPFSGAVGQEEGKYGFVNISQVITQTEEGLAEAKELESIGSEKQQELEARRQEIQELASQYQETVDSGNPDTELRARLEKMQRELERDAREAQSDVDVSRQDRIQKIGAKAVQVIQQFAEENGYTAIFRSDNGQMVYVAPGVDITDQIIAAYNEAHPVDE